MNLAAFTRAGLRLKEIGAVVGVSHTTAGLWMRGQRNVHYLLKDTVSPVIDAVDEAVREGDLPLSATVPRSERLPQIQRIIDRYSN